jgi:hypothetical protein
LILLCSQFSCSTSYTLPLIGPENSHNPPLVFTVKRLLAASPVEQAKWFREFWQSAAPKVGESSAIGFGQWMAEQHGAPAATSPDDLLTQPPGVASGGWSGWLGEVEAEEEAAVEGGAGTSEEGSEGGEAAEGPEGSDLEEGALPEEGDAAVDEVISLPAAFAILRVRLCLVQQMIAHMLCVQHSLRAQLLV